MSAPRTNPGAPQSGSTTPLVRDPPYRGNRPPAPPCPTTLRRQQIREEDEARAARENAQQCAESNDVDPSN